MPATSTTPRKPAPRPTGRPRREEQVGPIARTLERPAPTFTLHHDDVDDAHPGEWVLRHGTGDTAEVLHRWHEPMVHAEVVHRATRVLHQHLVRVVDWKPGRHRDEIVAVIGSTFDAWQVTTYSGRGGTLWRRSTDGSFIGIGGSCYGNVEALARSQGPLVPVEVHNLPALVAELDIYRQVAGYLQAPEECLDLQCGEYFTDDGDNPSGIERCSHIQTGIATVAESAAFARVVALVERLEADIPATDVAARNILSGIRQALEQEDE